ncbi:hypothetical protein PRIPAC_76963 [Pristionchus pacificus]|uniref:Uncharacterized protein n=1 Tax=Pristionchus pacificus TaxID=54126 RepID=A0A454XSQ8_PRIPA|nr:hypothetical protein PRIPAC_76963 [Pristionchus pacificus]|eukprot:PDM79217.1 hypothetical protein PRIPAC_31796 [Pristionchus pacificus]
MSLGIIWAVAGLFGVAFALNFVTMLISAIVFWPQAFTRGEYEELGLIGSVIFLCCARYYSQHLAATSGIATFVKPSRRTVVLRMLLAAAVCALTNIYCLAAVYCWIVLPGNTTPWYLVYNLWILTMYPMLFLMSVALRGVYYIGEVSRDNNVGHPTGSEADSLTDSSINVEDKKPLISEA